MKCSTIDLDPVHTRHVTVVAGGLEGGRREVRGRIIDLRHRTVTRVGEHATRPGLVHDMSARLIVDAGGRIIEAGGAMARAVFAGTAETGGEGCRDILGNVGALSGATVARDFARQVSAEIGGRRGCYHLTTLIRAMEPVAAKGAALERSIRVEGWRRGATQAVVRATLRDAATTGEERAGLDFDVDMAEMLALRRVASTHSMHDDHGAVPGLPCATTATTAAALAKLQLLPGFATALVALDPGPTCARSCAPVVQLAHAVNAVSSQILLHLAWPPGIDTVGGSGNRGGRAADTCVMWRNGGPIERLPLTYEDA